MSESFKSKYAGMKVILSFVILSCLLSGCKKKELPSEYLSNIPVARQTENPPLNASQPEPVAESMTEPENKQIVSTQPTPPTAKIRYHIIVSSFGANEKTRAEKMISQLRAKNYPATLLYSSQRYRVSIESFATEAEANAARDEYRAITDRQDIWVHKVQ